MFPKTKANKQPLWFLVFVMCLVLLPLPFGANRPWVTDFLGVFAPLLLLGAVFFDSGSNSLWKGSVPAKRLGLAALLYTAVLLWSFLQTQSWMPLSWQHPLWRESGRLLGDVEGSISLAPFAWWEAAIRFLLPPLFFILAYLAGRDSARAHLIIKSLAFAGGAYAFYGLLVHASGSETILWYKKDAYQGFLTSTFVNKNSYAAYAGLGLLCALAYGRDHLKRMEIKDKVLAHRSKAAAFFLSLGLKEYVLMALPFLILAALALTGSRAGVFSALVGVGVLFIGIALYRHWSIKKWLSVLSVLFLLFITFVALGGDALVARLQSDELSKDMAMRAAAYDISKEALQDNPYLGYGLGSFAPLFRLYRDGRVSGFFHHAHNDFLEMKLDLGVIAASALFLAVLLMLSCCVQGILKRRKDAIFPVLAVAATVGLSLHSLIDFNFHIPAIALTYAALLGVGVAQSFSSRAPDEDMPVFEEPPSRILKKEPTPTVRTDLISKLIPKAPSPMRWRRRPPKE